MADIQNNKNPNPKLLLILISAIVIIPIVIVIVSPLLSQRHVANSTAQVVAPRPNVSIHLLSQDILSYDNAQELIPYALIGYKSTNVSYINASITIYASPIPQNFYYLNYTNECYKCSINGLASSPSEVIADTASDLLRYGLISKPQELEEVSINNLLTIKNDSILIIINGLMPYQMFASNSTLITKLLQKNISILYVGGNFSDVLLPGSLPESIGSSNQFVVPARLSTISQSERSANTNSSFNQQFYLHNGTFSFVAGSHYGVFNNVSLDNGYVVAFSNYLSAWQSPSQAASDISKSILYLFWLPKYTKSPIQKITPNSQLNHTTLNQSSILMTPILISNNYATMFDAIKKLNGGYGRILIYGIANYTNSSGITQATVSYTHLMFNPEYKVNGSISMLPFIVPNQTVIIGESVFSFSPTNKTFDLYNSHVDVYDTSYHKLFLSLPIPYVNNYTNGSMLQSTGSLYLPPGNYILQFRSFYNKEYGAALFNVYPITIRISYSNNTKGQFILNPQSDGSPLTNIPYSININGLYPENGTVVNGTITYILPEGAVLPKGLITFNINILGQKIVVQKANIIVQTGITLNAQDVIIGIVIFIVVLLMLVRAPARDEIFIDVPHLSSQKGKLIKVKPDELVTVFTRMNNHYRWKFMPLNPDEFRIGVASTLKYENVPVNLTYNNIQYLLDELAQNDYLLMADNLYAPKEWTDQSKHDIKYLSTFKKLRIYLVTHGYLFTDLDLSKLADIVATKKDERYYLIIYSKTSVYKKVPVYKDAKTYLVFLNEEEMEDFKYSLYNSKTVMALELRMYIDDDNIILVDADNLNKFLR